MKLVSLAVNIYFLDPNGSMCLHEVSTQGEKCVEGEEDEERENELDWDRWMPDPIEALHHTGLWRRRIDLLSLLVGIYGSKKAFLVIFRNLLSERLLKQLSFDTAAQLRHLELLKLRFGESDMQECEVIACSFSPSHFLQLMNYLTKFIHVLI